MRDVQIAGRRAIKARGCTSAQVPDLQPERTSKGPSPAGHQGNSVPPPPSVLAIGGMHDRRIEQGLRGNVGF